ncbi:DUF1573 domain-containing protein [Candidatus Roizmanbacteria bacterium]|nr:DUF1573 domain-containing protein [Candidatus Roizmanbacteria bacterium]
MRERNIILGIVLVSALILFGGAIIASKDSPKTEAVSNENVDVYVDEKSFDWGEVDINNGKVEKTFAIKNNGSDPLLLRNVVTSCMCTTATLVYNGEKSPAFGMHQKSDYALSVLPGEAAELLVVFDPAFHGPSGVGPITRQILVETNDPDTQQLEFTLTAQVI